MSTTTKDEKPSLLEGLKAQAADLAAKIKEETDKHLETLHAKLKEAHEHVKNLTAEVEKHGGKPPVKRGRKPGTVVAKKASKGKGKRGQLGESILKFLSVKGKAGAHIKDIAAHLGTKPANVTAWFYSTGKSKTKKVKPATFALK
jgi:hypothetical protein